MRIARRPIRVTNPRSGLDGERSEAARRVRIASGRFSSIEPPTRGFSEIQAVDSIHMCQPVTGAFVAQFASQSTTMHSCSTQRSRTLRVFVTTGKQSSRTEGPRTHDNPLKTGGLRDWRFEYLICFHSPLLARELQNAQPLAHLPVALCQVQRVAWERRQHCSILISNNRLQTIITNLQGGRK